jgi:X-X-X-Leu-X-X-Gly heptad repeat protein
MPGALFDGAGALFDGAGALFDGAKQPRFI